MGVVVNPYREIVSGGKLRLHLHPGQERAWDSKARFVVMLAGTQGGKALEIDTPIPTPEGFKVMGVLQVGDNVYGTDGQAYEVTYVSPIFVGHDCYRVVFDDGTEIIADAEHLWTVQSRKNRKNAARRVIPQDDYQTLNTQQLSQTFRLTQGIKNYSIDLPQPVDYPERILPVPPYLLGAWLGDGTTRSCAITCTEPEIMERLKQEWPIVKERKNGKRSPTITFSAGSGHISVIAKAMHHIGVLGNKHIPEPYLTASVQQRLALLQGLMDTDGYCDLQGQLEYTTISPRLADDVLQLIRSLGIKARKRTGKATLSGRVISDKYRIAFQTDKPVFTLRRKLQRQRTPATPEYKRLFIKDIKPIPSRPTKCISVDSPNHLYLASTSYIPTHNTCFEPDWLAREIERCGEGDYIVGTATFPLLGLKLLPEFTLVFQDILKWGKYRASDNVILSNDGKSRIIFFSATNPESIESATAKAAVLDEAGQKQFRQQTWEAVQRRLSLYQGRALFGTTIYELGWLKTEVYDRWLAGDTDYEVIQFDSTLNPAFPVDEYERAKGIMPAWKFDMFYRGRYTKPVGLVYDSFDDVACVVDRFEIPKNWLIHVGHDFGQANPAAMFYAQDTGTGDFYAFDEYLPGSGKTAAEHVADWKRICIGYNVVSRLGGNQTTEEQIRQLYQAEGWPIRAPKWGSVQKQIMNVYAFHKLGKIKVFRDLHRYLDEKLSFSYGLDEKYQPTDKIDDESRFHLMAAERYVMSQPNPDTVVKWGTSQPVIETAHFGRW